VFRFSTILIALLVVMGMLMPKSLGPVEAFGVLFANRGDPSSPYPQPASRLHDLTPIPTSPLSPLQQKDRLHSVNRTRLNQVIGSELQKLHENSEAAPASSTSESSLFKLMLGFDRFSRLRYGRGVGKLPEQRSLPQLTSYLLDSRWHHEVLARRLNSQDRAVAEARLLRVFVTVHAGAHFFELPFPTFFCLLFQESRLDFTVTSRTGARGVAQLTAVGLQQVNQLRKQPEWEARLQRAYRHLGLLHHDPEFQRWQQQLGVPLFPLGLQTLPQQVRLDRIGPEMVRKTLWRLKWQGQQTWDDTAVRRLSYRLRRGWRVADRLMPVQSAFNLAVEQHFGNDPNSVFHPETNILLGAVLMRYYLHYAWNRNGVPIPVPWKARPLIAVAAYNHGQTPMLRLLIRLQREMGPEKFQQLDEAQLLRYLTPRRLNWALRRSYRKVKEVRRHVLKIHQCSGAPS